MRLVRDPNFAPYAPLSRRQLVQLHIVLRQCPYTSPFLQVMFTFQSLSSLRMRIVKFAAQCFSDITQKHLFLLVRFLVFCGLRLVSYHYPKFKIWSIYDKACITTFSLFLHITWSSHKKNSVNVTADQPLQCICRFRRWDPLTSNETASRFVLMFHLHKLTFKHKS